MRLLQDYAKSILEQDTASAGNNTVLLRILAGLVTAKVLGEWPASPELLDSGISVTSRISRGQAENVACAVRASIDLNAEYDGLEASFDTVGRMRSMVALREYASAETDPRVIREMWLLEDALAAVGEHQKCTGYRTNSVSAIRRVHPGHSCQLRIIDSPLGGMRCCLYVIHSMLVRADVLATTFERKACSPLLGAWKTSSSMCCRITSAGW